MGKRFYSEAGSPMKPIFKSELVDGIIELTQVGEENLQEYIDSFKDECSMEAILARVASGDMSALQKRQAMFGDFTDVPRSFAEIMQKVIDGRAYFDSLPLDVRQKYDQNFELWFSQIGSESWMNDMGYVKEEVKEVKSDES